MMKWLYMSCLLLLTTTSALQAQAPAGTAQWSVDGGPVRTLEFQRLFNTRAEKHMYRKDNGDLDWKRETNGHGSAFFENCTRPGEIVYGSDRVALRYGDQFVIATGPHERGWTRDRKLACQYRLIPSGAGLVPAGSGNGKFAIYNMANKRYLLRESSLVWHPVGGIPGGPVARADFVPEALAYSVDSTGFSNARLFMKNIGNVPSSRSQQEMQFKFQGQKMVWLLLQPVEPGASVIKVITLPGTLPRCVLVELDTDPDLKFQMLQGGLPNDFVFINDRRNMTARRIGPTTDTSAIQCEPVKTQ